MLYLNFWLIPEMAILSCSLTFKSCFKINTISSLNISDIIYVLPVMCYLLLNVLTQASFYWGSNLSGRCGPREPSARRKIFIVIWYMPINRFESLMTSDYLDQVSLTWFILAINKTRASCGRKEETCSY